MQGAILTQSHNPWSLATPPRSTRPLLFSNSDVGSFTSHKNKPVKVLWNVTYSFSSLSEKTRKSNHLQMSLQRQHFLLSYLKTLSVGRAGVWTRDLGRSADRRSTNWANQAAFRWFVFWISKPRISDSIKFSGHRNPDSFTWGEDIVKKLWNIKLQFTPLTETTSISFSFILGPSQPFQGWFSFSSDG